MNRRQVILTAILGMGVIPKVKNIFSQMFIDELLKRQVQNVGSTEKAASFWELIKNQFIFENEMYYFNQASLGTSPLTVIIATDTFRRKLETYPSKYMWGGWDDQIDLVRQQAAELLNAEQDEIALIHNTTEGMNVVASSLKLNPGDEVIVGNHEHRTATSPWLYHQEKKGVKIVRPELPMMPNRSNDILDVYRNAISDKTKVISMVHLTNTNGMILPVKEICEMAREKGIFTVIDGAQSMGVIPCDMAEIGCDFFTASGHKWVYAPKGIGIFYARKNVQKWLQPFIANRYYDQPGLKKIEDYNTRNLPDLLGLGSALAFHKMAGA